MNILSVARFGDFTKNKNKKCQKAFMPLIFQILIGAGRTWINV
jgi:hypothetical protein